MQIRIYSKQELALMYFPKSKPHTAVNHLMRWIGRCGQLRSALEAAHYCSSSRHFTARQVQLIVDYLGSPELAFNNVQ